jgi:hypothetical protein
MRIACVLSVLLAVLAPNAVRAETDAAANRLSLLVPAYSYPAGEGLAFWNQLLADAGEVPIVVVANPASGPGTKVDVNYSKIIAQAQAAGIRVIGYVATGYGKREAAAVQRDVDLWKKFYPSVEGVFLDEQSSRSEDFGYYQRISDYASGKIAGALLVSNPGTVCAATYAAQNIFDVICVFENAKGFESFVVPESLRTGNKTQFAALPHTQIDEAAAVRFLSDARGRGITYIYVTHDTLPNPWDELAKYWAAETRAVQAVNRSR